MGRHKKKDPFGVSASTIGARLRRIRQRQGLSIRQIAHLAGVGKNTISRVEEGDPTTRPTLEKICAALGVTPDEVTSEVQQEPTWVLQTLEDQIFYPDKGFESEPEPALGTAANEQSKRRAMAPTVAKVFDAALANLANGRLNCTRIELYGPRKAISHPGEEFVLCVRGRAVVSVGTEKLTLNAGDSASFWSTETHAYAPAPEIPEADLPVEILIVWVAS